MCAVCVVCVMCVCCVCGVRDVCVGGCGHPCVCVCGVSQWVGACVRVCVWGEGQRLRYRHTAPIHTSNNAALLACA